MRATDIIRNLLDTIDNIESADNTTSSCGCDDHDDTIMVASNDDDELRRFKQILGLVDSDLADYANSPDERITDVDSVTVAAGGGVNGPKHPADIRGEHGRLYGDN